MTAKRRIEKTKAPSARYQWNRCDVTLATGRVTEGFWRPEDPYFYFKMQSGRWMRGEIIAFDTCALKDGISPNLGISERMDAKIHAASLIRS